MNQSNEQTNEVARLRERLEKAEAEVAKLNHQLLKTESDLLQSQDINSFLDTEFRIACKRAEKAEAEVERLDHLLADASETNHKLGVEVERLKDERIYSY
jgi:septal ring factor EnvC (AmiA/AmiB activator)